MDKHTFKVGDRVIYTDSSSKTHAGAKGQYWEGTHDGGTRVFSGVKFDNDNLNRLVYNREFFSVFSHASLRHDTDFEVGDWVRYEGIHPRVVSSLLEGKIGQIDYLSGDSCAGISQFNMQSSGIVYKENLVKIQPPQEDKKMDIQGKSCPDAKIFGVHETVLGGEHGYVHKGHVTSTFYPSTHWEPVEEWVKIEVRKSQWDTVNKRVGMLEVQKESDTYPDTCTLSWRYPQ